MLASNLASAGLDSMKKMSACGTRHAEPGRCRSSSRRPDQRPSRRHRAGRGLRLEGRSRWLRRARPRWRPRCARTFARTRSSTRDARAFEALPRTTNRRRELTASPDRPSPVSSLPATHPGDVLRVFRRVTRAHLRPTERGTSPAAVRGPHVVRRASRHDLVPEKRPLSSERFRARLSRRRFLRALFARRPNAPSIPDVD